MSHFEHDPLEKYGPQIVARAPTFTATIYVGLRIGRTSDPSPRIQTVDDALKIVQAYVDRVGLCVTVTPTQFVYTNGGEPGVAVGLINYPRFPSDPAAICTHALHLAELLRTGLGQWRASIVTPDETVMLGSGGPSPAEVSR